FGREVVGHVWLLASFSSGRPAMTRKTRPSRFFSGSGSARSSWQPTDTSIHGPDRIIALPAQNHLPAACHLKKIVQYWPQSSLQIELVIGSEVVRSAALYF